MFYRIPPGLRTRLVKTLTPQYILGSVVLIFDSEAPGAETALAYLSAGRTSTRHPFPSRSLGAAAGQASDGAAHAGAAGKPASGEGGDLADQRILILRQPPSGRGWTLPAGLMDRGETPIQAARRETEEETGIVLGDNIEPAVPNAMVHTKGRWVDMVFTARVPASSTQVKVDGAEVWEAAWHRLGDLPKLSAATARLLGHYGIGPAASTGPIPSAGKAPGAGNSTGAGDGASGGGEAK
jgi:ADP-ribose pyrophosphatase YjhB (NUDIX family)